MKIIINEFDIGGAAAAAAQASALAAAASAATAAAQASAVISNIVGGWYPATGTWAYASATTITVPSGAASIYSVGDKIKLTANGVVLYAYIITVAGTLLTVAGDTLTNHVFSNCYYSKANTPLGFPHTFAFDPTFSWTAGTAPTGTGTSSYKKYSISGKLCTAELVVTGFTAGATVTAVTFPLPVSAVGRQPANGFIGVGNNPNASLAFVTLGTAYVYCSSVSADRLIFSGTYEIG